MGLENKQRTEKHLSLVDGRRHKRLPTMAQLLTGLSETPAHLLRAWNHLAAVSLLCGFWLEMRSFLLRIGFVCKTRPDIHGVHIGPAFQQFPSAERWEPCIRTRDCMRDIESLVADYPWATIVDRQAFRDSWRKGAEWALGSACIPDKSNKSLA